MSEPRVTFTDLVATGTSFLTFDPSTRAVFWDLVQRGLSGGHRGLGRVGAGHPIFREDCKLPLAS